MKLRSVDDVSWASAALVVLAVLLGGCVFPMAGQAGRTTTDSSGPAVFDGAQFRHRANTPFWCHSLAQRDGLESSSCHEVQEFCATDMRDRARKGQPVGACKSVEQVTCLTFFRGDGTWTNCFESPAHCAEKRSWMLSEKFGAKESQVTPCTTLDTSFHPSA